MEHTDDYWTDIRFLSASVPEENKELKEDAWTFYFR